MCETMASGAEGNSCSFVLMDIESDVLTALRVVLESSCTTSHGSDAREGW